MKLDILAIGAHPDDVELSCAGTLLKHISKGYKVGLLDLTEGELGSRGTGELRKEEAENARKKMGALCRYNLNLGDVFFTKEKESILKIIRIIRATQPDIVLANALKDRHPDHGRAAELTARACFLSGLIKIETTGLESNNIQAKWRPRAVYHYIQDEHHTPDFVTDISEYMDQKMDLILTFKSQFFEANSNEYSDQPKTPISGKDFMEFMKSKAKVFGRPIGVDAAEGFNMGRVFGVEDLFDLQ